MTVAAVFTGVVVAGVTVIAVAVTVSQWRAARRVIRITQAEMNAPVPYWPEEALLRAAFCGPCNDEPGDCECRAQCGELACLGGLTPATVQFLRSLTMPEGGSQ